MPDIEGPGAPPFFYWLAKPPLHGTPTGYIGINTVPSYPLDVQGADSLTATPAPATTLRVQGNDGFASPYGFMIAPIIPGDVFLSTGAEVFISPFSVKSYGGNALHERWSGAAQSFLWYGDAGLSFNTTYTPTQRMVLQYETGATGRSLLGVGKTTPAYPLDVYDPSAANGTVARFGGAATGVSVWNLLATSGNEYWQMSGAEWNGSAFVARATQASAIRAAGNSILFYTAASLTSGNTFSFTNNGGLDSFGRFFMDVSTLSAAFIAKKSGSLAWSLNMNTTQDVIYGAGMEYVSGTATARSTAASIFRQIDAGFLWYGNNGLTSGNSYTPTGLMLLQQVGTGLTGILQVNGEIQAGDTFQGVNSYLRLGGFGDPTSAYVIAAGGAANVSINLNAKGTGEHFLNGTRFRYFDTSGRPLLLADSAGTVAGAPETSIGLYHQNVAKRVYATAAGAVAGLPAGARCLYVSV